MSTAADSSGIAIVGIGCRFPGKANSPEQFWKLLRDGVDAITEFPPERFDVENVFDSDPARPGKIYIRRGGTMDNIDGFDPEFFGISPREARHIDPQQRLLLEVAYEALDDAGVPLHQINGTATGVFVGISTHDYGDVQMYPANRERITSHSNTGTATSIAANRLSYLYDLRGPSFIVDTACSSSLTAVHLAVQSLHNGECEMALVGGAQLLLTPEITIGFCKASMLSPTETCRAFDAGANGYVRSEGVAVIVLKPLAAALKDRDSIYAVIVGSAINQDGHTTGMTVPSSKAQAAMMRSALAQAGLTPADVHYVEAHGTGTPVGDPIEASAIGEVLGKDRSNGDSCVIGSVKTNIGHLEAASGMAGIIKTALAIYHRQIPPSLHFDSPNPAIDFKGLGIRVATSLEPWPRTEAPATAGVNSFGFGGANAHILLRESPRSKTAKSAPITASDRAHLLPISARSHDALIATAQSYLNYLTSNPDVPIADICRTAALRRTHHQHRGAIVASSREELADALEAVVAGEQRNNIAVGRTSAGTAPKLAFVFGGMGPQWWGMGRQLMRDEPVFRETVQRCDALLQPLSGWSLLELLSADESTSRVGDADVAQVTNFVIQAALTALWKSWGIVPDAVIGHSAGGIAAAHVSGVHDLAQTILLAFHRSRLQSRGSGQGTMLAVALPAAEAEKAIGEHTGSVSLGAVNSPTSCALTGNAAALEAVHQTLQERGVFSRMLQVVVPYHSAAMDPIEGELREALRSLAPQTASIGLVSDNTGAWADGADYDASYWWKTVREPVRFSEGVATLIDAGFDTFVEVGPHPVLAASLTEGLSAKGRSGKILPSIRRLEDERCVMLRSLGALWTLGRPVRWEALHDAGGPFVKLPTYAWQRERHWYSATEGGASETAAVPSLQKYVHPLLGARVRSPSPRWEARLGLPIHRWLDDHIVHDAVVFPGAAYVEMALALAKLRAPDKLAVVRDVEFMRALFLRPENQTILQTSLDSDLGFSVHSTSAASEENWTLHAQGRVEMGEAAEAPAIQLEAIQKRCPHERGRDAYYAGLAERGYVYGKGFCGITRHLRGENEAVGHIDAADLGLDPTAYQAHPALLDAAFQVLIGAASGAVEGEEQRRLFLPVGIAKVTLHRNLGAVMWSHARVVRRDASTLVGDIDVFHEDGSVCMEVRGLRCQVFEGVSTTEESAADWLYDYRWELAPPLELDEARVASRAALTAANLQENANDWSVESGWARYYEQVEPQLDRLATQLAADAFRSVGWNPAVGQTGSVRTLMEQLQIAPAAVPLGGCLLELLAMQGHLSLKGDTWRGTILFPQEDCEGLARAILKAEPGYATDLALMLRCGRALLRILRGDPDSRAVLLSPDALAELKQFYREAPASAFYNKLLIDAVTGAIAAAGGNASLRIVELGGGTGGTTASLLAALPMEGIAYTFTDISPFFVAAAEREFGSRPGFKAAPLDLERDLASQDFPLHSADIVIAANVFHATADLAQSLERARQLLAPGGLLVLLEITRRPGWLNVIFGVTDGWWKFTDKELRPRHPLLDTEQWQLLLAAEGFQHVTTLTDTNHPGTSGQTVLLAHSSGLPRIGIRAANLVVKWLIVSDRAGTALRLANALSQRGEPCAMVRPAGAFQRTDSGDFEARPDSVEDFLAVLESIGGKSNDLRGIVMLGALDFSTADSISSESLLENQRVVCGGPLTILTALDAAGWANRPNFTFVTASAQSVSDGELLAIGQSPLWGFARVTLRERADIRCQLIDLDRECSDASIDSLAREICAPSAEEELAFRGSDRWVHRLVRRATDQAPDAHSSRPPLAGEAWQLKIGTPGSLETLRYEAGSRTELAPKEVEIAVAAASLNFRDLMLAMGMLPTVALEAPTGMAGMGADCAGKIVRCGSDVVGLSPGKEVLAISPNALGSFARTRFEMVAPKPPGMSFEQAGALPLVFVTAHYGLHRLAHLAAGERVLIHAATGGVGLAAIQVARAEGAEIFATAGSPEKRAYLKSLGVERVMDSRSLAFVDQVLEWTNGAGVDVILNSLAGDAIPRGIALLSPCGRFVEIGKRDIYRDSKIGLLAFRKNLSLFAVDLDRLSIERPEVSGAMLREVMARFESGIYTPLPERVFMASEAETAMRLMAQAKHIGKIVIKTEDPNLRISVPRKLFRPDSTYLITGGAGGFGLATAEWMIREGARSLLLVGRSNPGASAAEQIAALAAAGLRVEFARGDVTRAEDVHRIVVQIRTTMAPLRGVFHAAMVLDDMPLSQITWDRLERAIAPKMSGAWNLHLETLNDELDYFILYSSIAAILGNPMQANYSAANAFLDALAHHRRALGRPALAVNWGVVADVGYVSHHPELGQHLDVRGYRSFTADQALDALAGVLGSAAAQVMIARIDWERLAISSPPTANAPGFRQFGASNRSAAKWEKVGSLLQTLLQTASPTERFRLLEEYVREKVGKALGIAAQRLDAEKPLTEIGLDSLIAVELVTVFNMDIGFKLPALKLLQGQTIQSLANLAANAIFPAGDETSAAPPEPSGPKIAATAPLAAPVPAPRPAIKREPAGADIPPPVSLPNGQARRNGSHKSIDYTTLDYRRWSPKQTAARELARAMFAVGARVNFEGQRNIPASGAFIVAVNHLCLMDVPLILTIMRRPVILLADDWLRNIAPARWILRDVGQAIFLRPGGDPEALDDALSVLRSGGIIGLSPEGARSKTGSLNPAQPGMAYLAAQASVSVVPIASWGHERMVKSWCRLSRPEIRIRAGEPITVPPDVSAPALQRQTERIMRSLAALLPTSYRGVYS